MPRKLLPLAVAAALTALLLPASASAFSFAPPQTRLAGLEDQQMNAIAAADVDGDGLEDAVLGGYDPGELGGNPVIAVLRGRANGSLGPATNYPMTGAGPVMALVTGDFNEDGSPDAVVGGGFSEEVGISLNDGEGAFEPPSFFLAGGFGVEGVTVADFDGDEHLDVASINTGASYSVLLGNGDGSFEPALTEPLVDWGPSIVAADLDDDGIADLALGNYDGSTLRILLGDGDGTFTAAPPVDLQPLVEDPCSCVEIWGLAAGDLNGDGREDLVTTDRYESRLFTVISNPDGTFTARGPYLPGNEDNPIAVALGDLNADGKLDAVTADYLGDGGTVLSGDGAGNLTAALEVDAGPAPDATAVADVDADGKPDLLFADQDENLDGGKTTMLRNVGQPAVLAGPAAIEFGDQFTGTVSAARQITVTNSGDALLRVTGVRLDGAGASDFLAGAEGCTTAPVPAGASCTIAVRFAPGAAVAREASLHVTSDAPLAPAAIALRGTGTVPAQVPVVPVTPERTRLVLALAQKKLRGVVGRRIQLSFATTLPGKATLAARPGGPIARRTLAAAGTGTLGLRPRKPGSYKLVLQFRARDGQHRRAVARLIVTAPLS